MLTTEEFQKLKSKALRLLAKRDHSRLELKRKLSAKSSLDQEAFNELVELLKNLGYMADEKDLASRWVKQWRSEGRGRLWISGKLREKGLPEPDLKDDDEELETARLFLDKRLRGKSITTLGFNEKMKLGRSMTSRGFSTSTVATVLKRWTE